MADGGGMAGREGGLYKGLELRGDKRNRGSERRRPQGALERQAGVSPGSHGGPGRPGKGSEPCWGRSREPQEGAGGNHCPRIAQSQGLNR